jgi:hypothetical protein
MNEYQKKMVIAMMQDISLSSTGWEWVQNKLGVNNNDEEINRFFSEKDALETFLKKE